MERRFRNFAAGLAAAALVWGVQSSPASAQNYPAKPVRIVVGLAPGGGTDIIARMSRLAWGAAFLAVAVLVLLELAVFLLMRPRELAGDRGES